jgi:hypothetical protein
MISSAGSGSIGLVCVSGQHGDGAVGKQTSESGQGGKPDDASTNNEHRIAVSRRSTKQSMAGD